MLVNNPVVLCADVNDLSYAGMSFEQLVKLSDERDMTVAEYLDNIAQRREELLAQLWSYRRQFTSIPGLAEHAANGGYLD